MIDNPEYKGEWKPRQIDNPDYKGAWESTLVMPCSANRLMKCSMISLLFSMLLLYSLIASPLWVLRVHAVHAILVDLDACVKTLVPSLNMESTCSQVLCVSLSKQKEINTHQLLQQVGSFNVQLSPPVDHMHCLVRRQVLLHYLCLLDDGDHVTGWEPHLVGCHEKLERIFVHPHG